MKLLCSAPGKALNKAYLKESIKREELERFKSSLVTLFERIKPGESEEHLKNILADFLKDTWYKPAYEINTSGRADLVIHNGATSTDPVGVLFEIKRPDNVAEMISPERPNAKALHELLLYYLNERYLKENKELKRLIVCNIYEWYIFDAADFERFFFVNKKLVAGYKQWKEGLFGLDKTDWFYQEIAKPFIEQELTELPCTVVNLKEFIKIARKPESAEERRLVALYKLLSPQHLLKLPFANDSNLLNREFYGELLHLIGLEEVKDKGKKLIRRKSVERRNEGSLLENAIGILKTRNRLDALPHPEQYGIDEDEQLFSVGLELCITWLNRLLFLKLLEGQLVLWHRGDLRQAFLNSSRIGDFDELNELFFEVLAVRPAARGAAVQAKFGAIPYLNSSLFEESELERATIRINELKNRLNLTLYPGTVLKEANGKRRTGDKNTLGYLFEFLDAYDFASEGSAEIQEQSKTLINASVLGLIFEKINGYRDGSFFTPGFITMYMSRKTIRRAVLQKFNVHYGWECQTLTELHNRIDPGQLREANAVVDSLKICDPAVGSGHFLVSALNEIIAIKSDLGILVDRDGKRLRDYAVSVENDELIIVCEDLPFAYNPKDPESRRVQETLFFEKATIIENCLFGVDINPKSVAICRLRLWIELLKNAYYTKTSGYTELETLPNIDINIKCGNSLVSRFALSGQANVLPADRKKLKELTERYRRHVFDYKLSPANKAQLRKVIDNLKEGLLNFGLPNDKDLIALRRKRNELAQLPLFALDAKEAAAQQQMQQEVDELERRFDEKQRSTYYNAFEWRFEFPEVLDENGEFVGFDAVIGNPPYIRQEAIKEQKGAFAERFGAFYCGTADIYTYFYKLGVEVLNPQGVLCYIAPNKFMRAGYGKNTRELLTTQATPLMIFDFGDLPVFEEATTYPSIVMVAKRAPSPALPLRGRELNTQPLLTTMVTTSPQRGEAGRGEPEEKHLFTPVPVPAPLLEAARALRGNQTDAEARLWRCLRYKQLGGYRFRRQHPIERFVLDFYCCEAKLAVELDGGQHNEPGARVRDAERTDFLAGLGIQVLRFWNNEVFSNLEGVLETIYRTLQERSPLPSPPPPGAGVNRTTLSREDDAGLNLPPSADEGSRLNLLPPAGGGREGGALSTKSRESDVFLTATFTDPEQLTRFAETVPTIGFTMPVAALNGEGWTLERPEVLALMAKLRQAGKPLGEYVGGGIYYGIKTGLNEAFVIDEATRARLIAEDPKSAEVIKPWLRGRDIKKWRAEWANLYVIFTRSGTDIEQYPAIKSYLEQFRPDLEPKRSETDKSGRKPGPYLWFEIQDNIAYFAEFDKPKIVYQEIATYQSFGYAEPGTFCNNKCFLIPGKDNYLLAMLNSRVLWSMICNLTSSLTGGARAMQMPYIEQLPIPVASDEQKTAIIALVEQVLAISSPLPSPPPPGEGARSEIIGNPGEGARSEITSRPEAGAGPDTTHQFMVEEAPVSSPQRGEAGRGDLQRGEAGRGDLQRHVAEDLQRTLEAQIDALVYQLYGLTPEEIAIVEQGASRGGGTP